MSSAVCLLRALLLCFEICGTVAHARASDEGLFLGDFLDILHAGAPVNPSGLPGLKAARTA